MSFSERLKQITPLNEEDLAFQRRWRDREAEFRDLQNLLVSELQPILEEIKTHYLNNAGSLVLMRFPDNPTISLRWMCIEPIGNCNHENEHSLSLRLSRNKTLTLLISDLVGHTSDLSLEEPGWKKRIEDELIVILNNQMACLCAR